MENQTPEARVIPNRAWLVWIVPVLALLVGGYVVNRHLLQRGPLVEIEFADAAGVTAERTKLVYKGIEVGLVEEVRLRPDLSGAVVSVRLDPGAEALARAESKFWIRKPEISLRGVSGLETLLSGVSLAVDPGEGERTLRFAGLASAPSDVGGPSSRFVLRASRRHGIAEGVAVGHRGVEVGKVTGVELAPGADAVLVHVRVDAPHDRLVRTNTIFWNASGIDVDMSLFHGLRVREGGAGNLLTGAIAFATPERAGERASSGEVFRLAESVDEDWHEWTPVFDDTPGAVAGGAASHGEPAHGDGHGGATMRHPH